MERKLQIVHLPEGHGIDRARMSSQIEKFYDKFAGITAKEIFMEVYFKEFHKSGQREQIQVKITLSVPGMSFHSTCEEWDGATALKKALDTVEKEYEHTKSRKKMW